MTYYPKNKIQTDLYSNGDLMYVASKQPYTGYYHKLFNGSIFTGKNQFDLPLQELTELIQQPEPPEGISELAIDPKSSTISNYNYTVLKKIKEDSKIVINNTNPKPKEKDYRVGMFLRYFLLKINEDIYLEIDKDTYELIKAKNSKYNWEMYIPFKLFWDIVGSKEEVTRINYNIVDLTEKRLNRVGLKQFLNLDYTKYLQK